MIDVHQHLWPTQFIDALRRRTSAPRLDGWTLHLDGEPPYEVNPSDHDVARRADLAAADGVDLALVSLSSPLGIEHMPAAEAAPLLDAYHQGVLALPKPFGAWAAASVSADAQDVSALAMLLDAGLVGLQLPATALLDASGYDRCGELLETLASAGKPLFVHPGPAAAADSTAPPWWPAMVPYVNQMHAAWYAFAAFGRAAHPELKVCFAMLSGLAPLHAERAGARGGPTPNPDDERVFVDTSSYGPEAIDPMTRMLGRHAVVLGSDRPYAPPAKGLDPAFCLENPARLLGL